MQTSNIISNLSCCINMCKNFYTPNADIDLYPLPTNIHERSLWCKILGIPQYIADLPTSRVCGLHFRKKYFLKDASYIQGGVTTSQSVTLLLDEKGSTTAVTVPNPKPNIVLKSNTQVINATTRFITPPSLRNISENVNSYIAPRALFSGTSVSNNIHRSYVYQTTPNKIEAPETVNLSINGELMLECQDDNLSTAQLSSYDTDLVTLKQIIDNVTVAVASISQSQATFTTSNMPVKISVNPIRFPTPLSSASVGQNLLTIPSSSSAALIPPNINTQSNIIQLVQPNVLQAPSTPSPTLFTFQPNSTAGTAAQVMQIQPQGSTNFQLVNSIPTIYKPQFLQIGNQQIQFLTPSNNSSISNPVSNILNQSNVGRPIISVHQNSITSYSSVTKTATVVTNSTSNIPSYLAGDEYLPPLAPILKTMNYEASEKVYPVMLKAVNEESTENIIGSGPCFTEEILPLTTLKDDEQNSTEINESNADLQHPESSNIYDILANPIVSCDIDQDGNEEDVDDPGVTNIFNRQSMPILSATLEKAPESNTVKKQESILTNFAPNSNMKTPPIIEVRFDKNHRIQSINSIPAAPPSSFGVAVVTKKNEQINIAENSSLIQADFMPSISEANDLQSDLGPVIIDVMSAKEGGQAIFTKDDNNKILLNFKETTNSSNNNSNSDTVAENNKKMTVSGNVQSSGNSTGPVLLQTYPKAMHPHCIFSLQKSIHLIPFVNKNETLPDVKKWLDIKTSHGIRCRTRDRELLWIKLCNEKFISNSVWWLVQKGYLPMNPPCPLCGCSKFVIEQNKKFFDGYCWTCCNIKCSNREPVKRPKFFESFKFCSLEELLLLTFHWVCQSTLEEILNDVKVEADKIWQYFKALQELCRACVEKKGKLGSNVGSIVEASAVKLGPFFILGAMERLSHFTRLHALTFEEAVESSLHLTLLTNWLNPKITLISETKIPDRFVPHITKVAANPVFVNANSYGYHTLNISRYLIKHMVAMFGNHSVQAMPQQVVQNFLYELMWRDRFGKFASQAFISIFGEISSLDTKTDYLRSVVQVTPGESKVSSFERVSSTKEQWGLNKTLPQYKEATLNTVLPTKAVELVNDDSEIKILEVVSSRGFEPKSLKTYEKFKPTTEKSLEKNFIVQDQSNLLFQDIPEVTGGENNVTPKYLLSIKISFENTTEEMEKYRQEIISLGYRLSAEGFIKSHVRWLVKKGFVKSTSACYVCGNKAQLKQNNKYSDGCSWLCQNSQCRFENVFKRPHFYARFPMLPIAHMAAMIFHWTVQSELPRIIADAPMDISKLSHVWRSFQVLCSTSLRKKNVKLGGDNEIVELCMVQYGKAYILGAMERSTRNTMFRAFPTELEEQHAPTILKVIKQWIVPHSFVVVNGTKLFEMPPDYNVMAADTTVMDPANTKFHCLNISRYLCTHIDKMFGHLKADDVRIEIIQIYLDELMWRERFGRTPTTTFYNILGDIFDLETKVFSQHIQSFSNFNNSTFDTQDCNASNEQPTVAPIIIEPAKPNSDPVPAPPPEKPVVQSIDPASLPELRIILKRIPEEVLKYYNCIDVVRERMKKAISLTKYKKPSYVDDTRKIYFDSCSPKVYHSNNKTYSKSTTNKSPKTSSSIPCDISLSEPPLENTNQQNQVASKKRKMVIASDSENSDIEVIDDPPCKSEESHSIAPTVEIKKEKVTRSRTVIEALPKRPKRRVSCTKQPESKYDLSALQNIEKTEDGLICIECGKPVTLDHFKKQFMCMDCKKLIYTTLCCNSFMEHRGALLFGKRMPRRHKDKYGLHKLIDLADSYNCSCGYSSTNGNTLASHLVECKKSTCYYHAEIS